jgi:hypothetical protein
MASMVVFELTVIVPVYLAEEVVGIAPFTV